MEQGTTAEYRTRLQHLHSFDKWPTVKFYFDSLSYVCVATLAVLSWQGERYFAMVICWVIAAHFLFVKGLAFHDASHGTLHPVHFLNEFYGHIMGAFVLLPLSVYRCAHAQHHAFLGSPRDPELWPYVDPNAPRWWRVLSAWLEVVAGIAYTPLLFLRGVLVARNVERSTWRRIAVEYAAMAVAWVAGLSIVHWQGWWAAFAVAVLVPLWLAAAIQTLDKFTQHLGLHGDTVLSATRTIAAGSGIGKIVSQSVQRVDHHGAHHLDAAVPYYRLPEATEKIYVEGHEPGPIYHSHFRAVRAMLPSMLNPKAGVQWLDPGAPPVKNE